MMLSIFTRVYWLFVYLWRHVCSNLCAFFIGFFIFLLLYCRVLYIVCILDLYQLYCWQIFYPIRHWFLTVSFWQGVCTSHAVFRNLMKPWTLFQQSALSHEILHTFAGISQSVLKALHGNPKSLCLFPSSQGLLFRILQLQSDNQKYIAMKFRKWLIWWVVWRFH